MDCTQCAEELTAFLDGELSAADAERIKSHLRTCIPCSEEARSLQEVGDFVESNSRVLDPRPESWNMVRARIYRETPESDSRGWAIHRWRFAMAALALLAALVIGYQQYTGVQQRNLDRYISQYVRERESRRTQAQNDGPDTYNPFMEVKVTVSENPFRSEDR
jgi:anti-sigma factor RsiW